jgi:uncharacterized protein YciI
MSEWVYFLHAPREDFAATMTDEEREVWGRHVDWLTARFEEGSIVVVGPTLGPINTGICVFEADDEAAAQAVMEADPAIASGIGRGELRPFRMLYLRGRD